MSAYIIFLLFILIIILGFISAAGIYLSQKFKFFETISSPQAIIIFFITSLIIQIIMSGPTLMSVRIGSFVGMVLSIVLMGLIGNLCFRIINYYLKNKLDQTIKGTFTASLIFPIIIQLLSNLRMALSV